MTIHIGKIIKEYLYTNKISSSVFAKMISINPLGASRIFNKQYLHSSALFKISQSLNHNFFQYYVSDSPQEKKNNEELEQKLLQLQNENEKLKTENYYLKEMYQMLKDKKSN